MDFQIFSPIYSIFPRSALLLRQLIEDFSDEMIDGRTIHFHFQYIYPELVSEARQHAIELEDKPFYPLANVCKQLGTMCAGIPIASNLQTLDLAYPLPLMLIANNDEELAALQNLLAEALVVIESAHLLWLLALALGAVSTCDLVISNCCRVTKLTSAKALAEQMLVTSANELRRLWMSAEANIQERSQEIWDSSDFSELVLMVFTARLEKNVKINDGWTATEFDQYVHTLDTRYSSFPLTKHLLCIWTLGWRRSVFLEGSPFDFAATLNELYTFKGTTAKGWVG